MSLEGINQRDWAGEFDRLARDPNMRDILQQKALEYLKTEDRGYFDSEFSGELDAEGYLLKKDGTSSNTSPIQNIGPAGLQRVVEMVESTK